MEMGCERLTAEAFMSADIGFGFGCDTALPPGGRGSARGCGDTDGSGFGSFYADAPRPGQQLWELRGIRDWRGQKIWYAEGRALLIDRVYGDYARGRAVRSDLTAEPCFIAKVKGQMFGVGKTLGQARKEAWRQWKALCRREHEFKEHWNITSNEDIKWKLR